MSKALIMNMDTDAITQDKGKVHLDRNYFMWGNVCVRGQQ